MVQEKEYTRYICTRSDTGEMVHSSLPRRRPAYRGRVIALMI